LSSNRLDLFDLDLSEASKEAKEIISLAYKYKIGHVASALSYTPVVDFVFNKVLEDPKAKILLGKPHGALALYRNWIKNQWINEEDLLDLDSVYLQKDQDRLQIPGVCYVANTLGNALAVGIGLAISDRESNYHVIISDSSFLMGTTLEAIMQLGKVRPTNLQVYVDWNGWTSKEPMPYGRHNIWSMLVALNVNHYFNFFENPKGHGIPEIEKEPQKWHY